MDETYERRSWNCLTLMQSSQKQNLALPIWWELKRRNGSHTKPRAKSVHTQGVAKVSMSDDSI
jgi:hypothetical protein